MARQLRFDGAGSGDPEDVAQLQHLQEDKVPIVVPRTARTEFGPRDRDTEPRILAPDQFARLFEDFQHSAWHLEMRRGYAVDRAQATYAQFTRGEAPTWNMESPWARTISAKTQDGAVVGRVRIVDNPPTEGQLYLLAHAEHNDALGEDVRNMWREDAKRVGLPDEDFWIFDSYIVALCLFDDDDTLTGAELVTDPARVNQYNRVRDIAQHYAVPYEAFALTARKE
ncbi:DUF6879 family protein [Streptomyces boncukensis]|uniref:DUF6879 domain-containing protein n=1 Tax=Streptomyces boncukensis TaxID=2711219 RepID=A0A6G4WUT5_9ACTN|nr:DUF6879 family protein [Streptomyces boncukensis]NGO69049.1 hypothetical protein [Streptomyces boncukensis]